MTTTIAEGVFARWDERFAPGRTGDAMLYPPDRVIVSEAMYASIKRAMLGSAKQRARLSTQVKRQRQRKGKR